MKSETQVTFRNIKPSKEIQEWIHLQVAKLDMLYPRLMGCRIMVELPHRHHKRGNPFHIRIDLTMPQGELVVKREPSLSSRTRRLGAHRIPKHAEVRVPHKDLRQAISDAFKAAGRRLQDYARRQRGDIKNHSPLPEGHVSRILPHEGYGFLSSNDGREIYFHKNSVLGRAFPRLKVGTPVRFAEEPGEKGPQASTVHLLPEQRIHRAAKGAAA